MVPFPVDIVVCFITSVTELHKVLRQQILGLALCSDECGATVLPARWIILEGTELRFKSPCTRRVNRMHDQYDSVAFISKHGNGSVL